LVASFLVRIVASVPEPETQAMLLAGLGLMDAVARRSKKSKNLSSSATIDRELQFPTLCLNGFFKLVSLLEFF
jgi:hypothetical protein